MAYWGSFLVTALSPGGVAEDVGESVPDVVGIPGHIAAAVWGMLAGGLGWYLACQPTGGTSRR